MSRHWRTYLAGLALILALTACPADPPDVSVATATGQPDQTLGEIDPYTSEHPAPAFSTVTDGALRLTLLSFDPAPSTPEAVPLDPAPQGTELAALALRVECLEADDHCYLAISEFQLLAGDDLFLPLEDFSSGATLSPGPMQQGEVQQTTLYYYLPLDQTDFVFRYNPLEDLWVDTIYMALPE